jgi:hypothetical protein
MSKLIELVERSVTQRLGAVAESDFEPHVAELEGPTDEHLYVVVERAWAHLDVEFDDLFEQFHEFDREEWNALHGHLDDQGLRAVQSPPTDAVERFAERSFRDRLEEWARPRDTLDYSRVAHDVYFSKWWKLTDDEYYALEDRSLVADLESARQSLVLLARGYATPGLRMSRQPTETEWGFVWQQYAWEGIVEHMLPVGSREQREPYETWAQTTHRAPFRDALNEFFFGAARDFVSIARRIDERHGGDD